MRIRSYNIGRGLLGKLEAIEAMAKEDKIDVLGLSETDILKPDTVPAIPGFNAFYETDQKKIRIIVYVKEGLPVLQKEKRNSMPAVILQIGQLTITMLYNDFTDELGRMTAPERRERLRTFLQEHDDRAGRRRQRTLGGVYGGEVNSAKLGRNKWV